MTADEVSALLSACDRERTPVEIVGGDTLRGMGKPLTRSGARLSMLPFSAIVEDAPADLTIAT